MLNLLALFELLKHYITNIARTNHFDSHVWRRTHSRCRWSQNLWLPLASSPSYHCSYLPLPLLSSFMQFHSGGTKPKGLFHLPAKHTNNIFEKHHNAIPQAGSSGSQDQGHEVVNDDGTWKPLTQEICIANRTLSCTDQNVTNTVRGTYRQTK